METEKHLGQSFDLELVQPFCSTAIIQLKEKE